MALSSSSSHEYQFESPLQPISVAYINPRHPRLTLCKHITYAFILSSAQMETRCDAMKKVRADDISFCLQSGPIEVRDEAMVKGPMLRILRGYPSHTDL